MCFQSFIAGVNEVVIGVLNNEGEICWGVNNVESLERGAADCAGSPEGVANDANISDLRWNTDKMVLI